MHNQELSQLPETKSKFFYGYIVVVAAFSIMMLFLGIFNSFGVFFKPLLNEFGWTRAVTSGAFSLNWVVQGLLAIIVGRLNDKFGPRIVLTFSGLSFGLGYLLVSQINALWQLYLLYGVLVAAGMSSSYISLASTVTRWFVKRRSIMTGIALAGGGIGGLIVPPLANQLISIYDWRLSYIILGGVGLVAIVLLAQLMKLEPAQMGQKPYGENVEEARLIVDNKSFSLWEATSTRQFWFISIIFLCGGFCANVILVHIAPHVTDLGFSAASAAFILAIVGGTSVIGRIAFGSIGDIIGNRQAFIIIFIMMAGSLFWLLRANEMWMLYLFSAVFGISYTAISVSESGIVAALFGLRSHGLILGVISTGYCIGAAVGPFSAGYIFDLTGSYQVAFMICAAIGVVGLILAVMLRPTKKLGGRI